MNRHHSPLTVALATVGLATAAWAADHREAPLIQEDPTADIADVYAFLSPDDPSKVVVALTVNPFAVPAEAVTYHFSPNVKYRFHFDADGDGRHERQISIQFSSVGPDGQSYTAEFPDGTVVMGQATPPTEEPIANDAIIAESDGVRVFAGPRDDPFFFDVVGVLRFLDGTGGPDGTDGFAGFNVSAVVVEVPLAMVGGDETETLGVWGSTRRLRITQRRDFPRALTRGGGEEDPGFDRARRNLFADRGNHEQVERMGNPAVATVLVPASLKDVFNVTVPANDGQDFAPVLVSTLTSLGTSAENIGTLASVAVPDSLKLSTSAFPTAFPFGRAPADDVIDVLLALITNGAVTGDGVDANDVAFATDFPFLAPPQQPL